MPTRDGFNLRRDHGFRNPPVQPPCPFPGPSGAWQHEVWPPCSSSPSSNPYKNDPQASFNFRRAPGPWRSGEPHHGHNLQHQHKHKQQTGVLAVQHPGNDRAASRSSGVDGGGTEKSAGEDGTKAVVATVPEGVATTVQTTSIPSAADIVSSTGEGKDGRRSSDLCVVRQGQERSAQDTHAAVATIDTAGSGSGTGGGHYAEEMRGVDASLPAVEGTPDLGERETDRRGVEGKMVLLETMGEDGEGEGEGGGEEEAEDADPDQGWMLSAEWEEYLRNSPGVSRYFQRMQVSVSSWKDGRGGRRGNSGSNGSSNNNNKRSGRKKSSSGGAKLDHGANQDSTKSNGTSSSSTKLWRQKQQQQGAAVASRGGKKSGKNQPKPKNSVPGGGADGDDSAVAIAKQALDLELAKIQAQALLYAEQQQHRRVEDAVADIDVAGPE